ncbi:PfkB family carbohydrate kinase [Actinopolymorpha singaporensis]|uniref:PfkB family carbohydrate kinase n=1 Tax=Actinopolymorpha singaporensis TaxID=117157 RepID=UPI0012FD9349|nr:PfkB family carbohydrate kinase [Actinopolymorpha singaporensis]
MCASPRPSVAGVARTVHLPAVGTREVVSTVGAGDALFAAFLDGWTRGLEPRAALRRAAYLASWKVGAAGGAAGFLDRAGLDALAAARS